MLMCLKRLFAEWLIFHFCSDGPPPQSQERTMRCLMKQRRCVKYYIVHDPRQKIPCGIRPCLQLSEALTAQLHLHQNLKPVTVIEIR